MAHIPATRKCAGTLAILPIRNEILSQLCKLAALLQKRETGEVLSVMLTWFFDDLSGFDDSNLNISVDKVFPKCRFVNTFITKRVQSLNNGGERRESVSVRA